MSSRGGESGSATRARRRRGGRSSRGRARYIWGQDYKRDFRRRLLLSTVLGLVASSLVGGIAVGADHLDSHEALQRTRPNPDETAVVRSVAPTGERWGSGCAVQEIRFEIPSPAFPVPDEGVAIQSCRDVSAGDTITIRRYNDDPSRAHFGPFAPIPRDAAVERFADLFLFGLKVLFVPALLITLLFRWLEGVAAPLRVSADDVISPSGRRIQSPEQRSRDGVD